jgi:DNA-binding transcriptional LysR family regulator
MELRHLRYFLAVAEELNFHRAAHKLHVAQPSLSSQIRQLEEELDARLLERNSHRVTLTIAGRSFLDGCRRILRDTDSLKIQVHKAAHGETGQLHVGFVPSLAHEFLPKIMQPFGHRFPEIDLRLVEMDSSQQLEQIALHQLDIGLIGLGHIESFL